MPLINPLKESEVPIMSQNISRIPLTVNQFHISLSSSIRLQVIPINNCCLWFPVSLIPKSPHEDPMNLLQAKHQPVEILQLPSMLHMVWIAASPVKLCDPDREVELGQVLDDIRNFIKVDGVASNYVVVI